MFYNGEPLYQAVNAFIAEYTQIPEDTFHDETDLKDIGIPDDSIEDFEEALAEHFDFAIDPYENNIGAMASVWHVTQFVEENI